jgi:hypothetical protein
MLRRIGNYVAWILGAAVGVLVLLDFFVDLGPALGGLLVWATIIAAFAMLLGLVNVARNHVRRIARREEGWIYSVALLLAAVAVLVAGLRPGSYGPGDPLVQWVFRYVLSPLAATFFSLLAFSLASAFFRTLRLRNLEATLVTVAAAIVLLGQVPVTPLWSFLKPIAQLQEWLLRVPAMAGIRAILIGAAIGAVTTAMRVILGLERPYAE